MYHNILHPLFNLQGAKNSSWLVSGGRAVPIYFHVSADLVCLHFATDSNCGCTALALRHSTLSAWRRAIFCAVLMFPGILAPGLVPGGPGPGINHAFPDQAARVQRPRHYRGQWLMPFWLQTHQTKPLAAAHHHPANTLTTTPSANTKPDKT